MGFQDVVVLPYCASFYLAFLMVVEVMALGSPYVLELWLWVSKCMLHVKYFQSDKSSLSCLS